MTLSERVMQATEANVAELEDEVWLEACDLEEAGRLQGVVLDWFLTRLSLWDTMNGGTAQTAGNHLEELPAMIAAWRRLGQAEIADQYAKVLATTQGLELVAGDGGGNWQKTRGHFDAIDDAIEPWLFALDGGGESASWHARLIAEHREAFAAAFVG